MTPEAQLKCRHVRAPDQHGDADVVATIEPRGHRLRVTCRGMEQSRCAEAEDGRAEEDEERKGVRPADARLRCGREWMNETKGRPAIGRRSIGMDEVQQAQTERNSGLCAQQMRPYVHCAMSRD